MSAPRSPIIAGRASVVRAAAGTGKTRLLTTRLIRLLFEGVEPGAILAITFTRKAAAEIYRRVVARLLDMVTADEELLAHELEELDIPVDAHNLRRARTLFEHLLAAEHELRATTFHAFCQEILRRFPLEAGVPPGFELMESTAELERAAWFALEREIHARPQAALAQAIDVLLQACGVEGTRQALEQFLRHRSDWWAYTEGEPDAVARAGARLERTLRLNAVAESAAITLPLLARYGELRRRTGRLVDDTTALPGHAAAALPGEALDLTAPLLLKKDGDMRVLKRTRVMRERLSEEEVDELLELHERLARCAQRRHERRQREHTARISKAWYRCGARLLEHYQRLKAEQALLDFADLEWLTYRLLNRSQHAEWVQYKLDQRVDHLLVDEFQDTNPTQWRLLLPLLREMASAADARRRSVFLVGDEKQSIYRFRRADPGLFNTAQDWLTEHMQAQSFTQDESWRASAAIIEFVNLVYDSDGDGDGAAFLLENFRRHATRHPARWGRVELLPIIRRDPPAARGDARVNLRDPLRQPRRVDEDRRYGAEGELVARKIIELVGRAIDDKGVRPLGYDDVMILLRDRAHAPAYEAALRRAGIPYVGTGRGAFMESLEIQDLMHLLRALSAPYDDLALASVLRSPVFACGHEELLRLARTDTERPWSERLAVITGGLAPDHALARAQRLLQRWAQRADRIPVHDLLDQIYKEGNVVGRYVSAAPAHLQTRVQVNLRRLLELALEVDGGRYPSLSRFLMRVPLLADEERAANAEASGGAYVRIMTIHAAKGLECPVVFLVDAMRDYRRHATALRALVDWPVDADRPKHLQLVGHDCGRDRVSASILRSQAQASRREEANLLYVAITRAKHALFISGCEPGTGAEQSWYRFLERRLRLAAERRPGGITGLQLPAEASPGGGLVFESGLPLAAIEADQESAAAVVPAEPGLSQPIVLPSTPTLVYPSRRAGAAKPPEIAGPTLYPEAAATRGVAIHRLLQLLGSGLERPAARRRALHEFGHRLRPADLDRCWDEACAVVDDPALRPYFDPRCYRRAHNELAVLYFQAGLSVYGIIDRVVEQDDTVVLLDYKTHRHATTANAHVLAEAYAEQLRLYAQGARQLWPDSEIRVFVLFTAPRCLVDMAGTSG